MNFINHPGSSKYFEELEGYILNLEVRVKELERLLEKWHEFVHGLGNEENDGPRKHHDG